MESTEHVVMMATVTQVCPCHLMVCGHCTNQEVLVHTDQACRFSPGDCVCIHYGGAMTRSLPPQITASCISRVGGGC